MKRRKYNIHGIISATLYLSTFGIGAYAIVSTSLLLGLLYILLVAFAFLVVAVIYCSKCKCREHCVHYFIGKISVFLSLKNDDPYNVYDLIVGLSPMLLAILFPQYWLIHNLYFLIIFWLMLAAGGLEVWFLVCTHCNNYKCKMCRNRLIRFERKDETSANAIVL